MATSYPPHLDNFTLFPQLATELRLKIWHYAIYLSPRVVELCQSQEEEFIERHDDDQWVSINTAPFYSPAAIPSILQLVNKESYGVALKKYQLCFPNAIGSHPAKIWFNAEIDTLYFPSWCFQDSLDHFELATSQETKNGIRKLARDSLVWYSSWCKGTINNQIHVNQFGGLEELILVNRKPDFTGCGCCHDFEGPEEGVAGLRVFEDEGGDLEREQAMEGNVMSVDVEGETDSRVHLGDASAEKKIVSGNGEEVIINDEIGELGLGKLQLERERARDERVEHNRAGMDQESTGGDGATRDVVEEHGIEGENEAQEAEGEEQESEYGEDDEVDDDDADRDDGDRGRTCRQRVYDAFREIARVKREKGVEWRLPRVKFAVLLRDGIEV